MTFFSCLNLQIAIEIDLLVGISVVVTSPGFDTAGQELPKEILDTLLPYERLSIHFPCMGVQLHMFETNHLIYAMNCQDFRYRSLLPTETGCGYNTFGSIRLFRVKRFLGKHENPHDSLSLLLFLPLEHLY